MLLRDALDKAFENCEKSQTGFLPTTVTITSPKGVEVTLPEGTEVCFPSQAGVMGGKKKRSYNDAILFVRDPLTQDLTARIRVLPYGANDCHVAYVRKISSRPRIEYVPQTRFSGIRLV